MDQVCFLTALFDTGSNPGLFADILHCVGVLAAYIIPCVLALLPIRLLTRIPSFIFRKLLRKITDKGRLSTSRIAGDDSKELVLRHIAQAPFRFRYMFRLVKVFRRNISAKRGVLHLKEGFKHCHLRAPPSRSC